jgi:hypothetical protein
LQGAVDILRAFRVASLALDPATSPTKAAVAFDAKKITYFGHSQGSTSGALAVAVSGAAGAAVFSGAGSFLTHSLLDKTNPVNIAPGQLPSKHVWMSFGTGAMRTAGVFVYAPDG